MNIRYPAVAGSFYPDNKKELREIILGFLKQSETAKIPGELKALVVPHAGYAYSGIVAAAGYRLLKDFRFRKFIIIGPSHFAVFEGASCPAYKYWETPLGKIKAARIESESIEELSHAHDREHSLEVQLPFLQILVKQFEIIPVMTGVVEPEKLANELTGFLDYDTLVIASSDLSHYYPYEKAVKLDSIANKAVPGLDIKKVENEVEACGKTAILTVMHIAKRSGWKGILIDYKNSGDTAGSREEVVGYGCYGFYE